jgi:hypothetical protein
VPLIFRDAIPLVFYADSSESIEVDRLELLLQLSVLVLQNHYLANLVQQSPAKPDSRWPILETATAPSEEIVELGPETPAMPPSEISEAPPEAPVDMDQVVEGIEVSDEAPVGVVEDGVSPEGEAVEEVPSEEPEDTHYSFGQPEEAVEQIPETGPREWDDQIPEGSKDWEEGQDESTEPGPELVAEEGPPESQEEAEVATTEELTAEEKERAHAEARRFARLLVTEIKLYNEELVSEGRETGNLYERLRVDIDRSREMYEKRAHEQVRSEIDYFHEQLVTVLAQDEPAKMGPDYPGAQLNEASEYTEPETPGW